VFVGENQDSINCRMWRIISFLEKINGQKFNGVKLWGRSMMKKKIEGMCVTFRQTLGEVGGFFPLLYDFVSKTYEKLN